MDLEKQLEKTKAELEKYKREVEAKITAQAELEKENQELKDKNAELEKTINDTKALLGASEKEKEAVQEELKTSKEDLEIATQAKEEAEEAGMKAQEAYKSSVADMVQLYRKLLNKPELDGAKLQERSIESLKDSIVDFKEEYNAMLEGKKSLEIIEKKVEIPNPVAPKDPTPGKTEKNPDYAAVDLSEGLEKLFTNAIG